MEDVLIEIFFDGACQATNSKKKNTGIGVAVYINKEYSECWSIAEPGDNGTNNIAEWCGCVRAVEILSELKPLAKALYPDSRLRIRIYSDSKLIVNQFNGTFVITHTKFLPYFKKARQIADSINFKYLIWIPREKNKQADNLSKIGMGREPKNKPVLILEE